MAASPPSAAVGAANFHMFHPKDHRKMALVALCMLLVAHLRRHEMRKRWLSAEQQAENNKQSLLRQFVDHPAGAYLLDNASVLSVTYMILRYVPRPVQNRPVYSLLVGCITLFCVGDPLQQFERFCAGVLYSHVPYFSERTVPDDWRSLLHDYATCTVPVQAASLAGLVAFHSLLPADEFAELVTNTKPIHFVPYLAKYAFCRLAVDVVFYVVHRAMHDYPSIYNAVHKRHHEHVTPRTYTNLHFSCLDLFLEAIFPVGFSLGSLWVLGVKTTYPEQIALLTSLAYYESASHTGKEIPTVTWFPLLSPLVDFFTGCDQRLIEYHTRHHQLYRCNYSISAWPDKLMGTYKMDLPKGYESLPQE